MPKERRPPILTVEDDAAIMACMAPEPDKESTALLVPADGQIYASKSERRNHAKGISMAQRQ